MTRAEYAYTTESLEGVTPTDTVNYTYGDDDWGDLLTAYDGVAISYDEIGNPLSDGTWTYTWEHGRELASMTDGTTTWTYTYNADGLRTSRTNGTATYKYVYNGSSLVQMTVGSDTLYFTDATVTYNNTVYYYVKNIQGDIIAILDTDGEAVVQYTYDAWGNILTTTGELATTLGAVNPLRYRGYVYDSETGLYYLQSRYYDPEIGRFLNADNYISTGDILGYNMFAYCCNNPVMLIDKSGQIPDSYAGGIGEDFGELIYEWLTGEEHPSKAAEEQEVEIRQRQNKLIRDGATVLWDAYILSIELEAEAQYQQDMTIRAHKSEVIAGISFIRDASSAIALYSGLVAVELLPPTFGLSAITFGKIAAVAAVVDRVCDKLIELIS